MSTSKFTNGIAINPNSGGKEAIDRLVKAYGFSTRQALCDHLGVSKSTMANRYMRDTFPSDWIIKCALETNVSLLWLTTGGGPVYEDARNEIVSIPSQLLLDGKLTDIKQTVFDTSILPAHLSKPLAIHDGAIIYLVDRYFEEVVDGKWLVQIEGKVSIRNLTRIPVSKVRIDGVGAPFECLLSDIKVLSKCYSIYYKEI